MCNCEDVRLFCNGYYPEIIVMDPFSLEILFMLSSKQNPDWISALHVSAPSCTFFKRINTAPAHKKFQQIQTNSLMNVLFCLIFFNCHWTWTVQVLRPCNRKDDVVLALTTTGMVKVWTLLGHETKHSEPIYENESKQIKPLNAVCIQCCPNNQRTVLVVVSKYWQVYDAGIDNFWFWRRGPTDPDRSRRLQHLVFVPGAARGAVDVRRLLGGGSHNHVVRCRQRLSL